MPYLTTSPRFAGAAAPPWSPLNLPSPQLWYDISDSAQVTLSGAEITSVASKGSNTTALVRHTNGPNGTSTTQNGLAVAAFDGTNDAMWLGTDSNTAVVSQPFTVALAAQVVTRVADDHLTDAYNYAGDRILITGDTKWSFYAGSSLLSSAANSDTLFHVVTAIINGASSSLRIDGVQVASGNPGAAAITQRWAVGGFGSTFTACNVGDIVVDATALSGTNLTDLESYLKTKWATP